MFRRFPETRDSLLTSKRAWLLGKALKLARTKAMFSDPVKLKAHLVKARKKKLAAPGKAMLRKFNVTKIDHDGVPVFGISPKTESDHHILYIHGGAYVLDIQSVYWTFLGAMVDQTGAQVVVPCYPLAPESSWEASYAWMTKVYDDLVQKVGAENITIMGDSAGAGFALGFAQLLRDAQKSLPRKLVLLSPWLDVTMTDPMQPTLDRKDSILGINGLRAAGEWWAGDKDAVTSAPVSPLFGEVEGLPPIAVFSGTFDLLWPDARKLKEKADTVGVSVSYHEYPAMQHVWMLFPIPEAKGARKDISDYINAEIPS